MDIQMINQILLFDLYDSVQEEINKNDMRRYIRAVHNDDRDTDIFIVWAEHRRKPSENAHRTVWKQWGYTFSKSLSMSVK